MSGRPKKSVAGCQTETNKEIDRFIYMFRDESQKNQVYVGQVDKLREKEKKREEKNDIDINRQEALG